MDDLIINITIKEPGSDFATLSYDLDVLKIRDEDLKLAIIHAMGHKQGDPPRTFGKFTSSEGGVDVKPEDEKIAYAIMQDAGERTQQNEEE